MMKSKKGFTIIELIVVIAIIGILVLFATPRLIGYVNKAQLTRIQHDIKVAENIAGEELALNSEFPEEWGVVNFDKLTELAQEKKLYDTKGLVLDKEIEDGDYVIMPNGSINTKLKGNFYANQGGKVYYEDLKAGKDSGSSEGNPSEPGIPGKDPVNKDDLINKKEEAEGLNPDDYKDFTDVANAVNEANKVIKDDNVIQDKVDDTLKNLKDAIYELIIKPGDSVYVDREIEDLLNQGYIPVSTAMDLRSIGQAGERIWGEGTKWKTKSKIGGLDSKYVQVNDIDLSMTSNFMPIGSGSASFTGIYDGGYYRIDNLKIDRAEQDYIGLFGRTLGALLQNIRLENINIVGRNEVGGLAGSVAGGTDILNSTVTGNVIGKETVGGVIGRAYYFDVTNTYTSASVTGSEAVGGLIGNGAGGNIIHSYAVGKVTGGGNSLGGLVGRIPHVNGQPPRPKMSTSYYDKETTGQSSTIKGNARTTEEMYDQFTYFVWDFTNVWQIEQGKGYPILKRYSK